MAPVAKRLGELLGQEVKFVPQTRGAELEAAVADLKDGEVLMVENTRLKTLQTAKKQSMNQRTVMNLVSTGHHWVMISSSTMPLVQHTVPTPQTLVFQQMCHKQQLAS